MQIYDLELEFEKLEYLEKLRVQFENLKDAALVFHLGISLLFSRFYIYPIYFTGKLVPEILKLLQAKFDEETFVFLSTLQKNIIVQRKTGQIKLDDEILQLKRMILGFKVILTYTKYK